MIEADGLCLSYGARPAVRDVSFSVLPGSVVAFLGPNGAGKSTTMRMLAGVLHANTGRVRICSLDMETHRRAAQARLGYLPEAPGGFGRLTVREFLTYCGEARGLKGGPLGDAIARVASEIDLGPALERAMGVLSKGWRQRAWLAQALLHEPPVLILDEPTDGLDPNQREVVRELIRRAGRHKAILLSTHSLEEAEALCDRTIVLGAGRILADRPTSELADGTGHLAAAFRRLTAALPADGDGVLG
jgi:ABC-2 type transport system ATP-binding protein